MPCVLCVSVSSPGMEYVRQEKKIRFLVTGHQLHCQLSLLAAFLGPDQLWIQDDDFSSLHVQVTSWIECSCCRCCFCQCCALRRPLRHTRTNHTLALHNFQCDLWRSSCTAIKLLVTPTSQRFGALESHFLEWNLSRFGRSEQLKSKTYYFRKILFVTSHFSTPPDKGLVPSHGWVTGPDSRWWTAKITSTAFQWKLSKRYSCTCLLTTKHPQQSSFVASGIVWSWELPNSASKPSTKPFAMAPSHSKQLRTEQESHLYRDFRTAAVSSTTRCMSSAAVRPQIQHSTIFTS